MPPDQHSGKQRNFAEIIRYNVMVINPKRISIRNINSGVKTSFEAVLEHKALVIHY